MNLSDLNGNLAVFGGITGLMVIVYMVWMGYWTRQKDKDLIEMKTDLLVRISFIEGVLVGGKKR